MEDNWKYQFPEPLPSGGKQVSMKEAETLLLSVLAERRREYEETLWQLAILYSRNNRQGIAEKYIRHLMLLTDDPEKQASYWLAMGQLMEQIRNFRGAVHYYKRAFSMEPTNTQTWYFINNNLGYSLIQLGKHADAEGYCSAAIKIDPSRHNAHKNLGLALQGQENLLEAAYSFIAATRANTADPRALGHLKALVSDHPDLYRKIPDLERLLEEGVKAVDLGSMLNKALIDDRIAETPRLSHAEQILVAVARLVHQQGMSTFSREDIRKCLGLPKEKWHSGYTAIFQAMRSDQPGGAPKINSKFKNVFQQVRHGIHRLTKYGEGRVKDIHNL